MKRTPGLYYVLGILAVIAGAIVYAGWFLPFELSSPLRAALGILLATIGINWLFGNSFHPDFTEEAPPQVCGDGSAAPEDPAPKPEAVAVVE